LAKLIDLGGVLLLRVDSHQQGVNLGQSLRLRKLLLKIQQESLLRIWIIFRFNLLKSFVFRTSGLQLGVGERPKCQHKGNARRQNDSCLHSRYSSVTPRGLQLYQNWSCSWQEIFDVV